jgi:UDP-N-acetylglucosamine diphosphorylase/glucosamine-1-phosphate N-acetyltransferase
MINFTKNFRMYYTLVDLHYKSLLPLTFAKPISYLRVGMNRIIDKWERALGERPQVCTAAHLGGIYPLAEAAEGMYINASVIPDRALLAQLADLPKGHLLAWRGMPVAMYCSEEQATAICKKVQAMEVPNLNEMAPSREVYVGQLNMINRPSDIFACNGAILKLDHDALSGHMRTLDFPKGVITSGEDIFVEEGATLRPCFLNADDGPIYIARGAEVMEGCMVRGPLYLGEGSVLKMGAKIYGPTTIGAHCKVGGEVTNSVIDDYSNKGHDGFLGNSVVGSWCNLGADTNTSNLKNNYSAVRVWNYASETMDETGLQFHGLVMGDHSKAGINTMFNTGAVVGMCVNIYGAGFPKKFVPSFSWGSADGFIDFDLDRAHDVAKAMMARRGIAFTEADKALFAAVFGLDKRWRE